MMAPFCGNGRGLSTINCDTPRIKALRRSDVLFPDFGPPASEWRVTQEQSGQGAFPTWRLAIQVDLDSRFLANESRCVPARTS